MVDDPIGAPTSHRRRTMIAIFFSFSGIALLDILPVKANLSFEYFRENIITELDLIKSRRDSLRFAIRAD
jgi:hypothetical protein